jgi:hypothetical protein
VGRRLPDARRFVHVGKVPQVKPPKIVREMVYTYNGAEHPVRLEIDLNWLAAQLARKAIQSKGKRSQAMAGALVMKVLP